MSRNREHAYEVVCPTEPRDAWLEARRAGIGASEAPALLGLVKWASPMSVQVDKWGLAERDEDEAEILKWGRRLEAPILEGLTEELEQRVVSFQKLLRSREHPFLLCTPDGLCEDGRFAQVKNSMQAEMWSERVPEHVWVQQQAEMAVTGHESTVVGALLFGNRLRWADVARDQSWIEDHWLPTAADFWEKTQAREPVAPDGSEATKRALRALYPDDSGDIVALPGRFLAIDHERLDLKASIKAQEARLAELDNQLRAAIGKATFAVLPDDTEYSLTTIYRDGYEVKPTKFRQLRRKKGRGTR